MKCDPMKQKVHKVPPSSRARSMSLRASWTSSSSRSRVGFARRRYRSSSSRRVARRGRLRDEDEADDELERRRVAFIDDDDDDDACRATTTVRTMSRASAMARALSASARGIAYDVETRDARGGGARGCRWDELGASGRSARGADGVVRNVVVDVGTMARRRRNGRFGSRRSGRRGRGNDRRWR